MRSIGTSGRRSCASHEWLRVYSDASSTKKSLSGLCAKAVTSNHSAALAAISESKYRLILVDMNIPALDGVTPALKARTPLVDTYPGLAVAIVARNNGYGAHAVIAYTVHDDDAAEV